MYDQRSPAIVDQNTLMHQPLTVVKSVPFPPSKTAGMIHFWGIVNTSVHTSPINGIHTRIMLLDPPSSSHSSPIPPSESTIWSFPPSCWNRQVEKPARSPGACTTLVRYHAGTNELKVFYHTLLGTMLVQTHWKYCTTKVWYRCVFLVLYHSGTNIFKNLYQKKLVQMGVPRMDPGT